MARELPIQNGRLTTDLDADGHRIRNLPGDTYSVPWENVTGKPMFANVATSGSYNDLSDRPTIPAPVSVDATLTTQGAAADAKATGDALAGKRGLDDLAVYESGWVLSVPGGGTVGLVKPFPSANQWESGESVGDYAILHQPGTAQWTLFTLVQGNQTPQEVASVLVEDGDPDDVEFLDFGSGYSARFAEAAAPTSDTLAKQSVLTAHVNDSAAHVTAADKAAWNAKQDTLSAVQLANIAAVPGKANAADLRYALVVAPVATTYSVPDAWFPITFTHNGTSYTVPLADKDMIVVNDGYLEYHGPNGEFVSMAYFNGAVLNVIAPGVSSLQFNGVVPVEGETALEDTHTAALTDRASNRVTPADASALTLTLPAAVPGYMRDLIVRLDLTALATAPEVTFAAPTGETVTFETEDGAMPEHEAGKVNLVSLTETAAGVIAVAHKTMQEVE